MENSLQTVVAQLEELFNGFNQMFYNGELQKPVITVSPDDTKGAYGWCTKWKAWQKEGTEGFYEINMCAEHLNRPFDELCRTLLHEMVHLWNIQHDVADTSRGGTYHNKKFKIEAEKRGLIIDQDPKYGWTITTLNDEGRLAVESVESKTFGLYRTKAIKPASAKKSSTRKYVCEGCGQSVRATKELRIYCGECTTEDNLVLMVLDGSDEC